MPVQLIKKLGDGGFADVWEGKDHLDRPVAVKIIREANVGVADALVHAKALARAAHPNVVMVYTTDKVEDPDTKAMVDCVVMELIEGTTLEELLKAKLTPDQVRQIGSALVDGVEHIHKIGLAHGDLHEGNVMVGPAGVKIIDILYLNTLSVLSTAKKQERIKRDLFALRALLQQILRGSELDPAEVNEFSALLNVDSTSADLRAAFTKVTSPESSEDVGRKVDHMYARFVDEAYDDADEYAFALAEETPQAGIAPLLLRVIDDAVYEERHRQYVQLLWQKLDEKEKRVVIGELAQKLNEHLPNKGRWWPHIRLLTALGNTGWSLLSAVDRMRLEGVIVNDVLAGSHNIFGTSKDTGNLGAWAISTWRNFSPRRKQQLAENLVALLRQSWNNQNYVAKWFLEILPELAATTGTEDAVVEAIYVAYRNDARLIRTKLPKLPVEWQEYVHAREQAAAERDRESDPPF